LTRCNPRAADGIVASGVTAGQLATNPYIPTLAQAAEIYGESTALLWLKIQIDNIDSTQGARYWDEMVVRDMARLVLAQYKDVNISNMLQFFARYKLGEYHDRVSHIGGAQRLLAALRLYTEALVDDVKRVQREEFYAAQAQQREEWAARAITYEEYAARKEEFA
jgi:hypothetical protein